MDSKSGFFSWVNEAVLGGFAGGKCVLSEVILVTSLFILGRVLKLRDDSDPLCDSSSS